MNTASVLLSVLGLRDKRNGQTHICCLFKHRWEYNLAKRNTDYTFKEFSNDQIKLKTFHLGDKNIKKRMKSNSLM